MPRLDELHDEVVEALSRHFGRPPTATAGPTGGDGVTLFERLAWVALQQVLNPKNVAAAFDALDDAGMLDPDRLAPANPLELDDILKRARVPAAIRSLRPLQKLARWAVDRGGPLTAESLATVSTATIRDEWRTINGIGLATADTLLLHGLGRASYPVDRATYRVLVRHGWLEPTADYDEARETMERFARSRTGPSDPSPAVDRAEAEVAAELVALGGWLGQVGSRSCKPTVAHCERCPLQPWLPPNGPVEVD